MPFNVRDIHGNHIGVIHKQYYKYTDIFMVAVTEMKVENIGIDTSCVKDFIAGLFRCKNLLGKIDEDKLKDTVEKKINVRFNKSSETGYDDFLKILFLKNAYTKENMDIDKALKISINENKVKGYILFDINSAEFHEGSFVLDRVIDYVDGETLNSTLPIFSRVMDYPVL